jgi:flagellar hook protein FlgE
MTMITPYQSALSALQSFGTKISSNANNIANSNTNGFKRTRVTLETMQPQGVNAVVEKVNGEGPKIYQETINGSELIEQSNVDLVNELTDMTLNSNYYKANLKTIQTFDKMFENILDIKA